MCGTGKGTARETEVIFAGSDSLASAILSQLKKLNLKCPQDIGVVGFNDISLSKNFSPALTTVRLPSAEMGKLAAEVLIRQIKSNSVLKQQILLPVELKVRESNPIKTLQNAKSAVSFPLPGNRTFSFYIFHRRKSQKAEPFLGSAFF